MKALILAAGRGRRLEHLTKFASKALVKIFNKEILQHQLDMLKKCGIKNVAIVVGYKKEKVKEILKKNKKYFKFQIYENDLYDVTDSAFSYYLARNFIKNSNYLHLNCDIFFDKIVLSNIISSNEKNIFACRSDIKLGNQMDLVKIKNTRAIKFKNKFYKDATAKVFGLAKFSCEISSELISRIKKDLDKGFLKKKCFSYLNLIVENNKIKSCLFDNKNLFEINTINDYRILTC